MNTPFRVAGIFHLVSRGVILPRRRLAAAMAAGILGSCATPPEAAPEQAGKPVLFEWKGEHLTGPAAVRIDLSEQKAYLTRGGHPAGWTYVASGIPGRSTPTGSYTIIEKVRDKHSNTWGVIQDASGRTVNRDARNGRDPVPPGGRFAGAPMPFWMRFKGPFGMHAGPIPWPGSPASHGCVRLPPEMAEILFRVSVYGTPVRVVP